MKIVCVIPARYGSSRFPGKPLMNINGKPMIRWVYEHCTSVKGFDEVIIATDDQRIQNETESFGAKTVMTPVDCKSPTERLFIVSQDIDSDFYVMVNGDEPTLSSEIISCCIPVDFNSSEIYVRNLMTVCKNPSDVVDTTNIKVVTDVNGNCMYLSRSPIPFPKGSSVNKYRKFVGVTGFTKSALEFFHNTVPGDVEKAEDVDELRFVENGKHVEFIEVSVDSLSVDSPKDVAIVESILREKAFF